MTSLEPISIALKYGFLVVLYLFLLWVARSAMKDLGGRRRGGVPDAARRSGAGAAVGAGNLGGWDAGAAGALQGAPDATGMFSAATLGPAEVLSRAPRLVVERAPGHDHGMIYDLDGDVVLGRGGRSEIRLEDPFASSEHARIYEQGGILAVEDLGSTNGSYLNEDLLDSPRPLHPGDRIRIGDSEFTFEID